MSTNELIDRIKASSKHESNETKRKRLIEAKILDTQGNYDPRYFSPETVAKSVAKKTTYR